MTKFSFWQKWLLILGILISVFGIAMALLSGTPLFGLFNRQIDPAFWGANAVDSAPQQFKGWIYGVWGATIAGWGIFLTFVAHFAFSRREKWAWNCVALGLLVWFILDTSLSIIYKVYFNVVFNVALIIFAGLPLAFTRRDFDIIMEKK